jgi:hypothetical protein
LVTVVDEKDLHLSFLLARERHQRLQNSRAALTLQERYTARDIIERRMLQVTNDGGRKLVARVTDIHKRSQSLWQSANPLRRTDDWPARG